MSSKQPGPALIQVPDRFSIVEPGVFRSASPTASQIPFLAQLQLRTIVSLTPEHSNRAFLTFVKANQIDFLHLGLTLWAPRKDWKPIRDEVVKKTLEMMLDTRYHPMLVVDPLGIHQTGCVVGALRMLQGWNFASTLVEYRTHSGPSKHRYSDEQFIELFDPDLVNLPPVQYRPGWFCMPDDEDEADEGVEDEQTAERETDGVVPGEGEATEAITGMRAKGDERNGTASLAGVG